MPLRDASEECEDTFHCENPFHQLRVRIVTPPPINAEFRLDLSYDANVRVKDVFTEDDELENFERVYRTCHLGITFSRFFLIF